MREYEVAFTDAIHNECSLNKLRVGGCRVTTNEPAGPRVTYLNEGTGKRFWVVHILLLHLVRHVSQQLRHLAALLQPTN